MLFILNFWLLENCAILVEWNLRLNIIFYVRIRLTANIVQARHDAGVTCFGCSNSSTGKIYKMVHGYTLYF